LDVGCANTAHVSVTELGKLSYLKLKFLYRFLIVPSLVILQGKGKSKFVAVLI